MTFVLFVVFFADYKPFIVTPQCNLLLLPVGRGGESPGGSGGLASFAGDGSSEGAGGQGVCHYRVPTCSGTLNNHRRGAVGDQCGR